MNSYRGPMPTGKDRQVPVEDGPQAQQPVLYTWPTEPVTIMPPETQPQLQQQESDAMGRRFTVIDSFHSEELRSDYVAGLSYEAQESDEVLLSLIDEWIDEGKVREGGPESIVSGTAEAEDKDDKKPKRK